MSTKKIDINQIITIGKKKREEKIEKFNKFLKHYKKEKMVKKFGSEIDVNSLKNMIVPPPMKSIDDNIALYLFEYIGHTDSTYNDEINRLVADITGFKSIKFSFYKNIIKGLPINLHYFSNDWNFKNFEKNDIPKIRNYNIKIFDVVKLVIYWKFDYIFQNKLPLSSTIGKEIDKEDFELFVGEKTMYIELNSKILNNISSLINLV